MTEITILATFELLSEFFEFGLVKNIVYIKHYFTTLTLQEKTGDNQLYGFEGIQVTWWSEHSLSKPGVLGLTHFFHLWIYFDAVKSGR